MATGPQGSGGTFYGNCPRCGLSIHQRFRAYGPRHCPRCIARGHTLVELFTSSVPTSVLYASSYAQVVTDGDHDDGHDNSARSDPSSAVMRLGILRVASDFDGWGGTSVDLTAWELLVPTGRIQSSWDGAVADGAIELVGPAANGEPMFRVTQSGWDELNRVASDSSTDVALTDLHQR